MKKIGGGVPEYQKNLSTALKNELKKGSKPNKNGKKS